MFDLRARALPILNVLAVALLLLHVYVAFLQPTYSFVDDLTYVSAAIHVVLGETCQPVTDNVCNYEHPPLAKLLMSLGFEIFGRTQVIGSEVGVGINQLGGRFFQMLMNSLSAPILYLVVNRLSGNWKMAFISGLFILVDPLYFTLSSTAGIDVAMVFFALMALIPYSYRLHLGKLSGSFLTGAVFGLSLLSKETAIFIILAIVSYESVVGDGSAGVRLRSCIEIILGAAAVFIVGLQLFDTLFTTFPNFFVHLQAMISFHLGAGAGQLSYLTSSSDCNLYAGLCPTDKSLVPHFLYSDLPFAIIQSAQCAACWAGTNPLDWLTYFPPVAFPTALVLAVNYPLVWMAFAWVPFGVWRLSKRKVDAETKTLLLAVSIFAWNIASNLWLFEGLGRAVFEWYFLPAVPALAIGGAFIVTCPSVPRWLGYLMVAMVLTVGLLLSPVANHLIFPQPQVCTAC